jgi:hypothetical protein
MNKNDKLPVLRREGENLVRVPGDIRDPNKRYALVGSPDGNYHREFTEEEERARDLEEKKWEEERPQREAEAKRQEEEFEKFRASLKYESRFVLFADILGWTVHVRTSTRRMEDAQKLGLALNLLKQQASMVDWMNEHSGDSEWPGCPRLSYFSDCLLASASVDFRGREWLISLLNFLSTTLLQQGFVLRGGLTFGLIHHTESFVFGPAMLRAYELEQSAKYPRIVLEGELFDQWGTGMKVLSKDGEEIGQSKTWRMSKDGHAFFDFMQPFPNFAAHEYSQADLKLTYTPIRELIVSNLKQHAEIADVRDKYVWLAEYFNEVISEHPNNTVSDIRVDAL